MNHIDPIYKLSEEMYSALKKAVKGVITDKETRTLLKNIVEEILHEHGIVGACECAKRKEIVLGIDFGTTSSRVAYANDAGEITVIKNIYGNTSTPSLVYFVDDARAVVGYDARFKSLLEPERTVAFAKRALCDDSVYDGQSKFYAGMNPTEISTYIFKKLVNDARDMLRDPDSAKKVVLACPACFGTKERERLKAACEAAEIKVLAVINEPTATAMAYGMKSDDERTVLVYDLGGGSFHTSVVRASDGFISVIAAGGDRYIGGNDWDATLAEYIIEKYNKKKGTSYKLENSARMKNSMMIFAENVKRQLTFKQRASVLVSPFQWGGEDEPLRMVITREIFDTLTEHLLEETIKKMRETINEAQEKGTARIDEVLLAGGSSLMPQVKARIDREFACNARIEHPEECVARGTALYGMQWNDYNSVHD